jgi:hypothetical protein
MRATGLRLAPWLVPAFLWAWLFFHLHYEWSLNPQYNYGWAVPVLAAFMFYLRWQARPVAAAATEEDGRLFFAQAMILALLLPVRVIEEANPDWRLLSWFFALAVVAYSLLSLAREGGWRGCDTLRFRSASPRSGAVARAVRECGHPGDDTRRRICRGRNRRVDRSRRVSDRQHHRAA